MVSNDIGGHKIFFDAQDDVWKYSDTKEPIVSNTRPCVRCGNPPTELGHDHCLRNLGRVTNACCGHGTQMGYIQFDDGTLVEGYFKVSRGDDLYNGQRFESNS